MGKIKQFLVTTLLGGVMVILPVAILVAVFGWFFRFVTNLIQPLTDLLVAKSDIKEFVADVLVLIIVLLFCFLVGAVVRTRLGKYLFHVIEHRLLKIAPGYTLIKETVLQILGNKKSPLSSVALVQIFENETLVTGFITDEHADGSYSVFVPTGPNPTSGNIFHLKEKYVHKVNVPVEEAMRSIISCGSGSSRMIDQYRSKNP